MKRYNLILVTMAFAIATAGAIAGQQNSAVTTVFGKTSLNQCLQGNPASLETGCSTAAASFRCSVMIYSTNEICPAYNNKFGSTCVTPLWYN
jgi:hypothetical protein